MLHLFAREAAHWVPAIEEPVHDTFRRATQRTGGLLESLFIGADKVLPVVAEDLVERIISKDAGAVSHGVYSVAPAGWPGGAFCFLGSMTERFGTDKDSECVAEL